MKREIAILTKSSKNGGYCVAGIDMKTGEWVRLVSDDKESHGALTNDDMAYEDGGYCMPLDVVEVEVIKKEPLRFQPENVLIDTNEYWQKRKEALFEEICIVHPLKKYNTLFGNTGNSLSNYEIQNVGYSLIMIEVETLQITHPTEKTTKASFYHNGQKYERFSVTDPNFYKWGNSVIEKAILIISLPDAPFYADNRYYKFVAKIFIKM